MEAEAAGGLLAHGLPLHALDTREHVATCTCRLMHRSCGVKVLYLALSPCYRC